jgi:hypothetical protein
MSLEGTPNYGPRQDASTLLYKKYLYIAILFFVFLVLAITIAFDPKG